MPRTKGYVVRVPEKQPASWLLKYGFQVVGDDNLPTNETLSMEVRVDGFKKNDNADELKAFVNAIEKAREPNSSSVNSEMLWYELEYVVNQSGEFKNYHVINAKKVQAVTPAHQDDATVTEVKKTHVETPVNQGVYVAGESRNIPDATSIRIARAVAYKAVMDKVPSPKNDLGQWISYVAGHTSEINAIVDLHTAVLLESYVESPEEKVFNDARQQ